MSLVVVVMWTDTPPGLGSLHSTTISPSHTVEYKLTNLCVCVSFSFPFQFNFAALKEKENSSRPVPVAAAVGWENVRNKKQKESVLNSFCSFRVLHWGLMIK